jgi:hypothetical protein
MATPKKKTKNRGPESERSSKAPRLAPDLKAEQAREAEERNRAQNAQSSIRERMIKIGRGNQQSGRQ